MVWHGSLSQRSKARGGHSDLPHLLQLAKGDQALADPITIAISGLPLGVSALNAWLTLFRRGTVKMTQPTVIFFGPDKPTEKSGGPPKVYLRTLLFSTSKRGRVIQSMHVTLRRNETVQNFNIWVHGDDKLVRGSGLFVGETGVAANHHFLTPRDCNSFQLFRAATGLRSMPTCWETNKPTCCFRKSWKLSQK